MVDGAGAHLCLVDDAGSQRLQIRVVGTDEFGVDSPVSHRSLSAVHFVIRQGWELAVLVCAAV